MAFDPKKICWLSGMPRSGTTWLSQIFASSPYFRLKFCPLFSYEFKHALNEQSTVEDWAKFFEDVYVTASPYMDQEHLRKDGLVPDFSDSQGAQSHLVIKSNRFHHLTPQLLENVPSAKVVYLVRHPAATIHSWLSNPTEFPDGADPLKEWRTGACRKTDVGEFWGFDDWKSVTLQALRLSDLHPERVYIQSYERLTQNALSETRDLFNFLGLHMSDEVIDFIHRSQSRHDPNKRSVFKKQGSDEAWRTGLDSSIGDQIVDELKGTALQQFALPEYSTHE